MFGHFPLHPLHYAWSYFYSVHHYRTLSEHEDAHPLMSDEAFEIANDGIYSVHVY